MSDCRSFVTPMIPNLHLDKATEDDVVAFKNLNVNYQSAIGGLSYLSTATRPDISFAVSSLLQFLENPGIQHLNAFIHVLRYLKGTSSFCLMRSTTGFVILIGDCLVTWKTRKQPTVSLSTSEAEYKALADLSTEVLWLRQLIQELNLMKIFDDNQGCICEKEKNLKRRQDLISLSRQLGTGRHNRTLRGGRT
ncbi:hypothetical protein O181_064652 [Austropuccinia psidii MF-1]|uniref:Reverse transcriptase Ty1/copia-type domain-containing protein n=1 Tax=Austropuccinia psidii MF-1 TaxID=1389203 RepID=A0A9Q3I2J6_9BASI|nr:hypothetical protein [Austropuccinia psidii MF-1]